MSFGELALMCGDMRRCVSRITAGRARRYNAPRAATVVASEDCVTWAVDQLTFKKTIMDTTAKRRGTHEAFISAVPILSTLNSCVRARVRMARVGPPIGHVGILMCVT